MLPNICSVVFNEVHIIGVVDKVQKSTIITLCRHGNSWRHGRHGSGTNNRKMRNHNAEDHKLPTFMHVYHLILWKELNFEAAKRLK
jgi:hypothetical protein